MTTHPDPYNNTAAASGEASMGYATAAEQTLAAVERTLDQWLQDDVIDIDCARSGGMLTLTLPNSSQIVINMQPPLQELWLAAQSGGFHFRWAGQHAWIDTKTGLDFRYVLSDCLSKQSGQMLEM